MTVGIACRYDGGVLLGSDSLVALGSQRLYTTQIKGFLWQGCAILFAGSLDTIQRFQELTADFPPDPDYCYGDVRRVRDALWKNPPPKKERSTLELVVVEPSHDMYIVSGYGDVLRQNDYAVAGSELAWVALDLEFSKVRNRTRSNTQKMMARVMRAVSKRDSTCDGALHYWAIE